jgi:hypothetical protein
VSPVVGWTVPEPLICAAKRRFVAGPSVCPAARLNWYVIVVAVLLLLWRI